MGSFPGMLNDPQKTHNGFKSANISTPPLVSPQNDVGAQKFHTDDASLPSSG